jgi:hypothetical protein
MDYKTSKHDHYLLFIIETVSYRGLFTAGWFGVREKYCSRLKIYDRLRGSEQAAASQTRGPPRPRKGSISTIIYVCTPLQLEKMIVFRLQLRPENEKVTFWLLYKL